MKVRIRNKVFRNRWRMNYALGQIFEATRGIILWINPGNGYVYYINYHNGKVYKIAEEKYPHCPALFLWVSVAINVSLIDAVNVNEFQLLWKRMNDYFRKIEHD